MQKDIVIAAMPFMHTTEPMMAPGYLKAIVEEAGYSAVALDLNAEFLNRIKTRPIYHQAHKEYNESNNPDKRYQLLQSPEFAEEISEEVTYMVERILSYNPKRVGLSLLAYTCQRLSRWVCVRLRQVAPEVEIVMGGCGTKHTLKQESNSFVEELKQQGLIDHFIMGDAERAIVEYMNGNLNYPGIDNDSWEQPRDLSKFPFPDYSDYDFDLYEDKVIPILDSQGCVRQCKFCDIIQHWQKFTFKKSSITFDEMIHQSEKHGIYRFSMRSSLSNGNMNEFRSWLELVSNYNETVPKNKKFSWSGYFIIRPKESHPEEMWEKLGKSQGMLIVGLETVIERSRWEIGKKFSNTDVDYHFEMGRKYNVPLLLLMMASNPGENHEDFEFTKKWFSDRVNYAGKSIIGCSWTLATILPGTAWDTQYSDRLIKGPNNTIDPYWREWTEKGNELTHKERTDYFSEIIEICLPFNSTNYWENRRSLDYDN